MFLVRGLLRPLNERGETRAYDYDEVMDGGMTAARMRDRSRVTFVGVRTEGSSIIPLLPRWAATLGIDVDITARDLPLDAGAQSYREMLLTLREDERGAGLVITSHKVAFFRHGVDLIDEIDRDAATCGEISVVTKRNQRLAASSLSAAISKMFVVLVSEMPFDGDVLCLGAGGAGAALSLGVSQVAPPSTRVVLTETSEARYEWLRTSLVDRDDLELKRVTHPQETGDLLRSLPPRSIVVNATGVGKDVPGSPLPDDALFPEESTIWDLNYRGDLGFVRQAEDQAAARSLRVEDGWRLFVRSWADMLATMFDVQIDEGMFETLARIAEPYRPVHV